MSDTENDAINTEDFSGMSSDEMELVFDEYRRYALEEKRKKWAIENKINEDLESQLKAVRQYKWAINYITEPIDPLVLDTQHYLWEL